MEDLFEEGFDTVFLALGAFNSNDMGCPGEDADGVTTAVEFLGDLEIHGEVHVGEKVTVIGGGFTAMDACRTSIRKGAKEVTCLYRRSRKEMPAHHTEVDEAEEEGVKLELLCAPVRVVADAANKVTGIEMLRMELGEPDASGRRRPVPIEGSEFVVECDQVITAIGQFPKLDGTSEEQGVKRTKWRTIQVDDWTFQTADPRVFAGGDVVLGAQTVIQAVAQGKKAAWSMDAYLRGADMAAVGQSLAELKAKPFFNALSSKTDLDPRIARMAEVPPVFIDMTTDVTHPSPPADMPKLEPDDRRTNFEQIELGFSEDEAVRGAELCLDCYCPASGKCDLQRYGIEYEVFKNRFHGGEAHDYPADFRHDFIMREPNRCINCGRCVRVCRMEVGSSCYDNMGRGYDTIVSTADNLPLQLVGCVSCGKCAETCPTGSIETNPRLLASYDLDESRCIFCGECVEVCPYDALDQSDFFELAGYNRTTMARESLYVREPRRVDPLRETVPDLVPHVRDAMLGRGWTWEPDQGRPHRARRTPGGGRLMPGGDFYPWLFVILAAWILVCALGVVVFRKIMYSAVSMVACFLGVAFAYALLNAPLVAVVQLLVYVGAISIVIIFAIMLTEVQEGAYELFFNRQVVFAAPLAVAAAAVLTIVIVASDIGANGDKALNPGINELSQLLFNGYVFPFELVSLVLVAAMIGAIVLARREQEKP